MLDAGKLLDQFLGTRDTRHRSDHRGGHGSYGAGRPRDPLQSGIEQAIGSVLGGGGHRTGSGGSALPGAIAGGLASYLLKGKRRKGFGGMGGSMARTGGTALLAGLAYKAFREYQARQAGAPAAPQPRTASPAAGPWSAPRSGGAGGPVSEAAFHPAPDEEDGRARLLLSAMIAAAKADGYIDREEQEAIFGRIDELDLDAEEKGFVMDEMRKPLSVDEIVRKVGSQEVAAEVYLASLLAIDSDHPAEVAYLDMLAARLNLPPALIAELRRTAEAE